MNIENAFRFANRNQIEAATQYTDTSLAILAAPGSGKTLTLILRIAFLLNKNIDPKSIFAVTFTKKAASEMKKRLSTMIPHHINVDDITLGTFHHCALNILRANARRAGLNWDFSIVSGKKQKKILEEVLIEFLKTNKFEDIVDKNIKPLTEEQLQGIIEDLESEDYRSSAGRLPPGSLSYVFSIICSAKINRSCLKSLSRKLFQVFDAYTLKLREQNQIDLPDILFLTTNLLQTHSDLLQTYQSRYRYLIVDEFQDTNHIQLEFISLIGSTSFVTVCGDDDQAIYGWRGATSEVFTEFRRLFPGSSTVVLSQNYRSSQNIVKYSQCLISHNKARDAKSVFAVSDAGPLPQIVITESPRQEAAAVTKAIKSYVREGYQYRDIAVLYRLHRVAHDFVAEMEKQAVPVRTKNKPLLLDKVDTGIIAYLRVVANAKDEEALMMVFNWPKRGLGDSARLRLRNTASLKSIGLWQAVEYLALHYKGPNNKGFTDLYCILKYFGENLHRLSPAEIVLKLMAKFSIEKPPAVLQIAENFVGHGGESLNLLLESVNCSQDPNVVTLSSIHQAKGQEWPIVFIVRVNEGVLPAGNEIEEERRLAYVAVTRAKKVLVVSCAMSGNKGETAMPSRFVDELFDENLKTRGGNGSEVNGKQLKIE